MAETQKLEDKILFFDATREFNEMPDIKALSSGKELGKHDAVITYAEGFNVSEAVCAAYGFRNGLHLNIFCKDKGIKGFDLYGYIKLERYEECMHTLRAANPAELRQREVTAYFVDNTLIGIAARK